MRHPLPALVLLALSPLSAQSNAVPGMDAQVYDVTDIAAYGRRGPAYPNGEAGFVLGHSYCNSGSVNIPWVATSGSIMVDTYPKIAFLLARESGGRMVQISGKSYLKHSTAVYNFSSGPCAPCNAGGGQFMFVGCSDTYSSGINSNRIYNAPTTEIDPWLGTWNSQGSYFDRGDPSVGGAAATDRVKSLTSSMVSAFDPIKNRLEVRDGELAVPGATFWSQVQLVIQGEPVANRHNNAQCRPVSFSWSGSAWNTGTTGASTRGSVLTQWSGASTALGGNGNDDGRFLVAVKVTGPVGGVWHYEYAVHNLDNARGGATLRLPVAASAQVTNAGFRDLDTDAQNDWVFARTPGQITFTGPAANPLDWNTLYNFWFDCTIGPSLGHVLVDESRTGPGLPQVTVDSQVPSGIPTATVTSVGQGCGNCAGSFYESFATAGAFDLANNAMTLTLNNGAYSVGSGSGSYVPPTGTPLTMSDDSEVVVPLPFTLPYPNGQTTQLRVCSNGFISPAGSNGTTYTPSVSEFLGGQPRWAAAWHDFNPAAGGQVVVDQSPTAVLVTWLNVPNYGVGGTATFQCQFLSNGTVHILWRTMNPAGNGYVVGWTPGGGASDPGSRDLSATLPGGFSLCAGNFTGLALGASARPILGTTVTLTTSNIPTGTSIGLMLLGFTQAIPPIDLTSIGMPGCTAHVTDGLASAFVPASSSFPIPVPIPSDQSLTGLRVIAQSFTYGPPLTPLGLIAANGLVLVLGPQ
jgi:hypothetical protein